MKLFQTKMPATKRYYAKGKYKRPIVNAVQVLDLIETGPATVEFTEDEVAF